MKEIFETRTVYLATEAAAKNAEQEIKDWLVAHADASRARRALSDANQASSYDEGNLSIISARCARSPYRRCTTHQVTVKNADQTGYSYCASLHMWTLEGTLLTGIIASLYAEPMPEKPDADGGRTRPQPGNTQRVSAFRKLFDDLAAEQNRDRDTTGMVIGARDRTQTKVPGIYIMLQEPEQKDKASWEESLVQLQKLHPDAAVIGLNHRMLVEESSFVPDEHLRRWLAAEYRVVSIGEQGQHEVTFPENDHEIAESIARIIDAKRTSSQNSIITSLTRNLVSLTLLASGQQPPEPHYEGVLKGLGEAITPEGLPLASAVFKAPTPTTKDKEHKGLEQELAQLKTQLETREQELDEAQRQIENLNEALRHTGPPHAETGEEQREEHVHQPGSGQEGQAQRANLVLEAVTSPHRFTNLRFLETFNNLTNYGRQRPTSSEILEVLADLDRLAASYYAGQGDIGDWQTHLDRPGWKYVHTQSPVTMGRDQRNRTFNDSEGRGRVVVERHLTCLTAGSGLQIFFDRDDKAGKFFIAYIGEHLINPSWR